MKILIRLCLFNSFLFMTLFLKAQSSPPDLVVYFASDSHAISPEEQLRIDSFVSSISKIGMPRVFWLNGHTDADGSEAYNKALASRRMNAVYKKLPQIQANLEIYGETDPVKPNDIEANKRWNRRVEIWVEYPEKRELAHINEVLDDRIRYQKFCINPSRDTLIIGEDGTILNIKANSFQVHPAKTSCLTIRLREFLSIEAMLMARLSTTSNGRILESGGMIYVDAIDANEDQVELKTGATIHISIPAKNPVPGMEVFYGHQDSTGHVNWDGNSNTPIPVIQPNGLLASIMCSYPQPSDIDCRLFFCGIRQFFRRMLGRPVAMNQTQRVRSDCEWLTDSLFKAYGVTNYQDYLQAVNKDLMDSLNFKTYTELQTYLNARAEEERKLRLQNGQVSSLELSYYAFGASQLGFINCDRFSKLDLLVKGNLRIRLENPKDYHVSIVFPKINSIMNYYALEQNDMVFNDVPAMTRVQLVIMKHVGNGMVELCIRKANTSDGVLDEFEFERVTVDELPQKLAGL